jgi:hypothetical protein
MLACENVLFVRGTGNLTCTALDGSSAPATFNALDEVKDSTFDSKLLARGLTSVSCSGCDAINKRNTCTGA